MLIAVRVANSVTSSEHLIQGFREGLRVVDLHDHLSPKLTSKQIIRTQSDKHIAEYTRIAIETGRASEGIPPFIETRERAWVDCTLESIPRDSLTGK